jgi:hypothetical protein
LGLFMDLLASAFAYLGTVTAIVVAVVMSYNVFVYTPLQSINPQHTLTDAAKPSAPKAALPAASVPHAAPAAKAASQIEVAAERRAAALRRETARQKRRLSQARSREWVSRQGPRVLGYAEQAPEGLYNAYPYR